MKNLKPFDLEAAKAGAQVMTRDGRKARVICFDRETGGNDHVHNIVALVPDNTGREMVYAYGSNGSTGCNPNSDLLMVPVKRTVYINVYKTRNGKDKTEVFPGVPEAASSADIGAEDWGRHYYHIAMPVEIEE